MNVIKNKKSEVNQIFTYVLSIIIIGFCGFLVVKFLGGFLGSVDTNKNIEFYEKLKSEYVLTLKDRGSEKIFNSKISSEISNVCFMSDIQNETCLYEKNQILSKEEIKTILETNHNIFIFSEDSLLKTLDIGNIQFTKPVDCECFKNINNKISFYFVNNRGKIFIEEK
jgi:hypothetical protein